MAAKLLNGRTAFTQPRISGCQLDTGSRKRPPAKRTNDITELHKQIDSLERDKRLKDDTIYFLQKEKERLQREIRHYEHICENIVEEAPAASSSLARRKMEEEIINLKRIVKKQSALLRSSTASATDRKLVCRISTNLISMLQQRPNNRTNSLILDIENQQPSFQKTSIRRGDTTWHLIEIIDKSLMELKALQDSLNTGGQVPSAVTQIDSFAEVDRQRPATTSPKRSEVLVVARQRIKQNLQSSQTGNRCKSAPETPALKLATQRTTPFRKIQAPATCTIELPGR